MKRDVVERTQQVSESTRLPTPAAAHELSAAPSGRMLPVRAKRRSPSMTATPPVPRAILWWWLMQTPYTQSGTSCTGRAYRSAR